MTSETSSLFAESEDLHRAVDDIARRLSEIEAALPRKRRAPPGRGVSDRHLADIVESIYRARRRRARFFPGELFAEPAWDMLLDLFISKARGQRVSTTSVTLAAEIPLTTGLRWIAHLEEHDLLHRFTAPDDARLKLLELSAEGYRLMRSYITEYIERGDTPLPG